MSTTNEPLGAPSRMPIIFTGAVANAGAERDAFNRPYKVGWAIVNVDQPPYVDGDDGRTAWTLKAFVNLTKEATDQVRELGGLRPNELIHMRVVQIFATDGKPYKTRSGEDREGKASVRFIVDRIHLPGRPDQNTETDTESDAAIAQERRTLSGIGKKG
ncbi:hypothetical protein AB0C84_40485 [Actinomadura sp. NPDC048955]|uniref:hypothetical protein n=1 Tax=Actinomadura sp. NPDC048955 TaxID=3158228 RepID=UPI0033EE3A85